MNFFGQKIAKISSTRNFPARKFTPIGIFIAHFWGRREEDPQTRNFTFYVLRLIDSERFRKRGSCKFSRTFYGIKKMKEMGEGGDVKGIGGWGSRSIFAL